MKSSLLALFVVLSTPSAFAAVKPEPETCETRIEVGTKSLAHTKERFRVGEVSTLEVSTAELDLLDVRFDCNDITKKAYCAAALPAAKNIVEGTIQYLDIGEKTQQDVDEAKVRESLVIEECNFKGG